MKKKWYWLVCIALPLAVGGLAGFITRDSFEIYSQLNLPPFSPPGWVFPVAWTILYLAMGIASGLVLSSGASQEQTMPALRLYVLQLAVNFVWPILFFGQSLYLVSFFWLLLLLLLVLLTTIWFYKIISSAGILLIPYLGWLIFAGYLNFGFYILN